MIRFKLFLIFSFLSLCLFGQTISYHPNSYWEVTGQQSKAQKNDFHNFFGQYGFPSRFVDGTWKSTEWLSWKDKNSFSWLYLLDGHSWQTVIERNKEIFQKCPEYLAEINGVRVGYGKSTKFCVSNKELQALFISDRIKAFEQAGNLKGAVSVEPSDGEGFCECKNCKKIGSISDQVFFLANLVAKTLRHKYPNGKVNLLAYYTHSEVPHFDLEPNVHVTVVPQGFQDLYDPEVMLSIWSKKAKLRTYYEYFGIPQWTGQLPRLQIQNYIHRMQLARQLGYQGFWLESGLDINTSIALGLFHKLWLNPNLTWENISDQFLRSCFKDSYVPMKRLFTRWWHTWIPDNEVAMAINDLSEASGLARSAEEKLRLADLKSYLHFIALYQDWTKDRSSKNLTQELFSYVYNSANRMIINVPAFYSLFNKYIDKNEKNRYNLFIKNDWSWIRPVTTQIIEENFHEDEKSYGKNQSSYFFSDLPETMPKKFEKSMAYQSFSFSSKLSEKIFFYGKGKLKVQLLNPIDIATQNDNGLYLSILASNGQLITRQFISYSKTELAIQLPRRDLYSLSITQFFDSQVKISGTVILVLEADQRKRWENDIRNKEDAKNWQVEDGGVVTNYYFLLPRKK